MRYELLKKYEKEIKNGELDKIIVDNYNLDFDNNLYFKVGQDGNLTEITIESNLFDQEWIKDRDIHSKYLSYNKKIGENNTMSNNLYTLFFKLENIQEKITLKLLKEKYFDILHLREINIKNLNENIKVKKIKEIEKLLLKDNIHIEEEEFIKIENIMLSSFEHFSNIYSKENIKILKETIDKNDFNDLLNNLTKKTIKLFYDVDMNNYSREINKYLRIKLINDLNDCKIINNEIYGVPCINISGNVKKTFLENKTMDCSKGFYLNIKDIFNLYKIDTLLKTFKITTSKGSKVFARDLYFKNDLEEKDIENISNFKKENFDFCSLNLKTEVLKSGYTITDYNVVNNFSEENKVITLINYMNIMSKEKIVFPNEQFSFSNMESKFYYLLNPNQIKKELVDKKKLKLNYDNFNKFLQTGDKSYIKLWYKKFFNQLLIDIYKVKDSKDLSIKYATMNLLNLQFSFENYLEGGITLDIEKLKQEIINKIENNIPLESNEEFLFLYGQVYHYLIAKSKAKNKNLDLINLPLRSTNLLILELDLKRKVNKYAHSIRFYNSKFTVALNLLLTYEFKGKLSQFNNSALYVGLTYDNLFYYKNEKENDEDEK